MYKKNRFDRNDPMLEDIMKIVEKNTKSLKQEYIDAAKAAGKESKGLSLADRKEVFKKHIQQAQEACGTMMGATEYTQFDAIAIEAMNSGE